MKRIDARGLSCPQPVILTKKALEGLNEDHLEVLTDDPVAKENILRFGQNAGYKVEVIKEGKHFLLRIQNK